MNIKLTIEKDVYNWALYYNFFPVNKVINVTRKIIKKYEMLGKVQENIYPFYTIILPLLQVGLFEWRKEDNEVVIFVSEIKGINFNRKKIYLELDNKKGFFSLDSFGEKSDFIVARGESFLSCIPDINQNINNFPVSDNCLKYKYKRDEKKYKFFEILNSKSKNPGIYAIYNTPFSIKYLCLSNNKMREILPIEKDIEAIYWAEMYLSLIMKDYLFYYNSTSKELVSYCFNRLPVVLIRGLILSNPMALLDEKIYTFPYSYKWENININCVKQLERIVTKKGVKYD